MCVFVTWPPCVKKTVSYSNKPDTMRRLREHFSNTPRPVYIDTMDKVTKNYSNLLESKKSLTSRPITTYFIPGMTVLGFKWLFLTRKWPILEQKWPISVKIEWYSSWHWMMGHHWWLRLEHPNLGLSCIVKYHNWHLSCMFQHFRHQNLTNRWVPSPPVLPPSNHLISALELSPSCTLMLH